MLYPDTVWSTQVVQHTERAGWLSPVKMHTHTHIYISFFPRPTPPPTPTSHLLGSLGRWKKINHVIKQGAKKEKKNLFLPLRVKPPAAINFPDKTPMPHYTHYKWSKFKSMWLKKKQITSIIWLISEKIIRAGHLFNGNWLNVKSKQVLTFWLAITKSNYYYF